VDAVAAAADDPEEAAEARADADRLLGDGELVKEVEEFLNQRRQNMDNWVRKEVQSELAIRDSSVI